MLFFNKIIPSISSIQSVAEKITREDWHALEIEKVLEKTKSSLEGISHIEAKNRLRVYGKNELPKEETEPAWKLFLKQFNSPLMFIMIVATIVSFFTGNNSDTIFIAVVAISNVIVGFYQEHKANKSLESLKNLIKPKARIIRADVEQETDVSEITIGDIVVLRAGDKIPADGRIIECGNFRVNEASLTGESKAVSKDINSVAKEAQIADRLNMVFMGTVVEDGQAKAIVVETGVGTQYGDIVKMLGETPEESTPLQKTIISLSKIVGVFITLVVLFITLEGYIAGRPLDEIFAAALALFVSAIPEGLLPAITIVLTIGMRRILKQKGLVRRLAATETLGGVTFICTDKTGTLTEGKMSLKEIITADGNKNDALRIAILSIDAYIENPKMPIGKMIFRGRPTEQALLEAGVEIGIIKQNLEDQQKQIDSIFFSSERKFSASLRDYENGTELCVIGAPEVVLDKVSFLRTKGGAKDKNSKEFEEINNNLNKFISQGLRIIAVAHKTFSLGLEPKGKLEQSIGDLTLIGFIALHDPVRKDVKEAIINTQKAGIRMAIVTGDHKETAKAVASEIGIKISDEEIIEGSEMENMSDKELENKIYNIKLYSRVSPRHKLRIVNFLQSRGEIVAVFGDGVNDAPALKIANIGVAVDTQIDAVREVADIVLLNGSFVTIVKAIEQGRIIFSNIRRIFLYLITQDFSQFFLFLVSIALGLPFPLLPAQLLLVNIVESGLPDLSLTTEEEKDGIMEKKPRNPNESIVNRQSAFWMIFVFATSGGLAFALYYFLLFFIDDLDLVRSMITAFLCMESLFLALSLRSFKKNIVRKDLFSNKWVTGAVVLSFFMILAAIYIEPFAKTVGLVSIPAQLWLIIIGTNVLEIALIDRLKIKFLS